MIDLRHGEGLLLRASRRDHPPGPVHLVSLFHLILKSPAQRSVLGVATTAETYPLVINDLDDCGDLSRVRSSA